MKPHILVYHIKKIISHISSRGILLKSYIAFFLLFYSLSIIAQSNVKSGNIRDCNVWNFPASGTILDSAKIIEGTTIQSNPTATTVSSIQLNNNNSTIKMSTGDKIMVTPGGTTNASACPNATSNYESRASNDYDNWLFNSNGDIYARIGQYVNYVASTDVNTSASGQYVIRGLIFVAQVLQNAQDGATANSHEVGYISKKTIEISLSTGGRQGSGYETIIGTLKFNFSIPRKDYVDGNWKYTTTICDYNSTYFLSQSACLLALRNPKATLAPFMLGDVDFGYKCYNNMDRITESGLLSFEYSPSIPLTFAAGEKVYLTIKNIHDPDLANLAISARFLNVASEIYLIPQAQF